VAEAKRALDEGLTHYGPTEGLPGLREAICEHLSLFGIKAGPEEVLVTPGASFALFLALKATVGPGDEVLLPAPTWFVYPSLVKLVGGRCVFVDLGPGYEPKRDVLEGAIGPRTKAIVVNTPNNPCGRVLSPREVRLLADLALEHDLYVISDEVYKMIIYDGMKHTSLASVGELREEGRVIMVDAFSKAYAMTGWRLGYLLAPEALVSQMAEVQRALLVCVPPFVQRAGVAALRGPQDQVREMVVEYQARRDLALKALSEVPGIKVRKPEGGLYLFPDLSAYGVGASTLVSMLEREHKVRMMPGDLFGPGYGYFVRISFCRPRHELLEGLRRLKALLARLGHARLG